MAFSKLADSSRVVVIRSERRSSCCTILVHFMSFQFFFNFEGIWKELRLFELGINVERIVSLRRKTFFYSR